MPVYNRNTHISIFNIIYDSHAMESAYVPDKWLEKHGAYVNPTSQE